jgi:hypothetical protein
LNNIWLKIKMRCSRGKNYAWGCTCSCGIHYSHYEATGYLLRLHFLKMMRIPYKVYHLLYMTKLSCTCRKRIKWRKQNKTKQNKRNKELDKMKSENKISIIIYTRIYLPGNGAKKLTRPKSWCLLPSIGVSK